jgi:hypothetical protein
MIIAYLDLVADVDDEGVGDGFDDDPLAVGAPYLQALDVVVHQQHGHAAGVGVPRYAQRQLWLRALRVEVDPQARPFAAVSAERRLQSPGFQPQPAGEQPHHPPAQLQHFLAVLLRCPPSTTTMHVPCKHACMMRSTNYGPNGTERNGATLVDDTSIERKHAVQCLFFFFFYRREEGREGHFSWLLREAGSRWRK